MTIPPLDLASLRALVKACEQPETSERALLWAARKDIPALCDKIESLIRDVETLTGLLSLDGATAEARTPRGSTRASPARSARATAGTPTSRRS